LRRSILCNNLVPEQQLLAKSRTGARMKSAILLRIAAVVTLLYCLGHSLGMPWTPSDAPADTAVIAAMKSHPFDVLGVQRTYWDFYFGFGTTVSVYLLLQAVVLWQVANLSKAGTRVNPIVGSFFVGSLVNIVLVWRYFFAIPLVMSIVVVISLGMALAAERADHKRIRPRKETA
jgi:hypothetical protein